MKEEKEGKGAERREDGKSRTEEESSVDITFPLHPHRPVTYQALARAVVCYRCKLVVVGKKGCRRGGEIGKRKRAVAGVGAKRLERG